MGSPPDTRPWLSALGVAGTVLSQGPDGDLHSGGFHSEVYVAYQQFPCASRPSFHRSSCISMALLACYVLRGMRRSFIHGGTKIRVVHGLQQQNPSRIGDFGPRMFIARLGDRTALPENWMDSGS